MRLFGCRAMQDGQCFLTWQTADSVRDNPENQCTYSDR